MDTVDDMTELESLPVEQLVELIREKTGAGVNLSFPGKVLARQLGRRVRPRTMRTVKAHSAGTKVLCVDTKASFIIEPEARRKLLAIEPHKAVPTTIEVKLVTTGTWKTDGTQDSKDGYSIWALGSGQSLRALPFADLESLAKSFVP